MTWRDPDYETAIIRMLTRAQENCRALYLENRHLRARVADLEAKASEIPLDWEEDLP